MAKTKILTIEDYDHNTYQLDSDNIEIVKDFNLLESIVNT